MHFHEIDLIKFSFTAHRVPTMFWCKSFLSSSVKQSCDQYRFIHDVRNQSTSKIYFPRKSNWFFSYSLSCSFFLLLQDTTRSYSVVEFSISEEGYEVKWTNPNILFPRIEYIAFSLILYWVHIVTISNGE